MTRRAKDFLAILIGLPAAYLVLAGFGWGWTELWRYGGHAVDFEWWHPALAAFLASGTGAAVLAFTPAKVDCAYCEKLELKLRRAHREIDETRQALLELAPPGPGK